MPKSKAQAIGEQVAHFTLLGVLLTVLSPFVSIPVLIIREFTDWPLPWVFKGQFPPGTPVWLTSNKGPPAHYVGYEVNPGELGFGPYAPMDRVEDLRLDVVVTLAGILVGLPLHAWWLVRVFL